MRTAWPTQRSPTSGWPTDTDINGATTSSYTVVAADAGKAIKVTVSFTDDAGNAETLTSAATAAVTQPPLTATVHDKPSSHDGSNSFTFELRFSENIEGLSYKTLQEHALTVTGGTLAQGAEAGGGQERPVGDHRPTVLKRRCDHRVARHHGLRRPTGAICTGDGRKLSSRVELTISGPGG